MSRLFVLGQDRIQHTCPPRHRAVQSQLVTEIEQEAKRRGVSFEGYLALLQEGHDERELRRDRYAPSRQMMYASLLDMTNQIQFWDVVQHVQDLPIYAMKVKQEMVAANGLAVERLVVYVGHLRLVAPVLEPWMEGTLTVGDNDKVKFNSHLATTQRDGSTVLLGLRSSGGRRFVCAAPATADT